MKRLIAMSTLAMLATLFSMNAHAYRQCLNGDTPKFRGNAATYYVEPLLWNHLPTRRAIVNAFNDWNAATGWRMKFTVLPGSSGGSSADQIFQVRTKYLKYIVEEDGTLDANMGQSQALSTREPGQQCYWWDNDIVLSEAYLVGGVYTPVSRSTYWIMLHEIGHALGLEHNDLLSIMNVKSWLKAGTGLFGPDILPIRELYGTYPQNINRNFRSDSVMLRDTYIYATGNVDNQYEGPGGPFYSRVKAPYTVTNLSSRSEWATIEILGADDVWSLLYGTPRVLRRFFKYIKAGDTASGSQYLFLPRSVLGEVSQFGFRVVENDTNRWDDTKATE